MLIARTIAIWFFGLVSSAILGFFIGTRLFNLGDVSHRRMQAKRHIEAIIISRQTVKTAAPLSDEFWRAR